MCQRGSVLWNRPLHHQTDQEVRQRAAGGHMGHPAGHHRATAAADPGTRTHAHYKLKKGNSSSLTKAFVFCVISDNRQRRAEGHCLWALDDGWRAVRAERLPRLHREVLQFGGKMCRQETCSCFWVYICVCPGFYRQCSFFSHFNVMCDRMHRCWPSSLTGRSRSSRPRTAGSRAFTASWRNSLSRIYSIINWIHGHTSSVFNVFLCFISVWLKGTRLAAWYGSKCFTSCPSFSAPTDSFMRLVTSSRSCTHAYICIFCKSRTLAVWAIVILKSSCSIFMKRLKMSFCFLMCEKIGALLKGCLMELHWIWLLIFFLFFLGWADWNGCDPSAQWDSRGQGSGCQKTGHPASGGSRWGL